MPAYQQAADVNVAQSIQSVVSTPGNLQGLSDSTTSADNKAINDASTASNTAAVSLINSTIFKNVNQIASINDSLNANDYIERLVRIERSRIDNVDNTVRNEQYKLRSKLMGYTYLLKYYQIGTGMVVLTLFVSVVMLLLAALWRCDKLPVAPFVLLVAVILVGYALVVIMVSGNVATRNPNSWDRRLWTVRNQKKILADA